ncbi:MAG: MFS transporter [Emcibacter sp.]|nr:MFS transporter [Emcibacter sp.]
MTFQDKKIFYGWYIVVASTIGICFGYVGSVVYVFSSFIMPISDEFGWGRGDISFGLIISNVIMVVVVPTVGILIDKKGVKNILLPSTIGFGIALCSFYFLTDNIWYFYSIIAILTIFGGATASISYVRLIMTWFDQKKGLALGLGLSGAGLSAMFLPSLVHKVIDAAGWREAFVTLGAINLLVVVPIIYFFMYNQPSDKGQLPDGRDIVETDEAASSVREIYQRGYTVQEALRTSYFWKLLVGTTLFGAILTGAVTQLIPLLVDVGLTRGEAVKMASFLGISLISSRILAGYLLDRYHAPFVSAGFLLLPVIGFASVALMPNNITAFMATVGLGAGLGLEFDVIGFFCVQYFGRPVLGRMYSFLFVGFGLGGGLGSFFAGRSYDLTSSYQTALLMASAVALVGIIVIATLGRYPELPDHHKDEDVKDA